MSYFDVSYIVQAISFPIEFYSPSISLVMMNFVASEKMRHNYQEHSNMHQCKFTKTKAKITSSVKRITLPITIGKYHKIIDDCRIYRKWGNASLFWFYPAYPVHPV